MTTLDDLRCKKYLVVGRVGMDISPDPAGTATEDASTLTADM